MWKFFKPFLHAFLSFPPQIFHITNTGVKIPNTRKTRLHLETPTPACCVGEAITPIELGKAMPDMEEYLPFNGCDTAGIVYSGVPKLRMADGNSLFIIETELDGKSRSDMVAWSSGICCSGMDMPVDCATGGVVGGVSELSVIGGQVEHVWITSGVFVAGQLNGGLLSNSV